MAEITGVVVGVVGLASLFNTCLELFDRFELGVHHVESYKLACGKIDLLKLRLAGWGEASGIRLGSPAPQLETRLTEKFDVVSRSLAGIKAMLESASALTAKYQLVPSRQRLLRTSVSHCTKRTNKAALTASLDATTIKGLLGLRKRTSWAVHDKQRFDQLISDLSFLIDNLEKVVAASMPCAAQAVSDRHENVQHVVDQQPSQALTAVTITDSSAKSCEPPQSRPNPDGRLWVQDSLCITSAFTNVYKGGQENVNGALGVMGNVNGEGPQTTTKSIYQGLQKNDGSAGVMGNVPSDLVTSFYAAGNRSKNEGSSQEN